MIMLQLASSSIHLSASSGVSDASRNFVVPDRRSRRATRPKFRKGNESTIKIVDSSDKSDISPSTSAALVPTHYANALNFRRCPTYVGNYQLKKLSVIELGRAHESLLKQVHCFHQQPMIDQVGAYA